MKFYSLFTGIFLSVLFLISSCKHSGPDHFFIRTIRYEDFTDKVTVDGTLEAVMTHNISCPADIYRGIIQYLITEGTFVEAGDTVVIIESREMQNEYEEALKKLEVAKSDYNESKASLKLQRIMLESQVKSIENNAKLSDLDSLQWQFTTPADQEIIELELERSDIEKARINKKLELLKKIHASELRKKEIMIKKMENRLNRIKTRLDQLVLTTPANGIVMHQVNYRTREKVMEGDPVRRKLPIVKIPEISEYQISMNVMESDYKRIKMGQPVNIQVDAYPELKLKGKIKHIAPVGIPIRRNSEVKEFNITASLENLEKRLEPGLTASCDIIIQQLKDTIMVPAFSVFEEDSIKFVYRKQGSKYTKQPVEIAFSNTIQTVIKDGLSVNDKIALKQPDNSLIWSSQ